MEIFDTELSSDPLDLFVRTPPQSGQSLFEKVRVGSTLTSTSTAVPGLSQTSVRLPGSRNGSGCGARVPLAVARLLDMTDQLWVERKVEQHSRLGISCSQEFADVLQSQFISESSLPCTDIPMPPGLSRCNISYLQRNSCFAMRTERIPSVAADSIDGSLSSGTDEDVECHSEDSDDRIILGPTFQSVSTSIPCMRSPTQEPAPVGPLTQIVSTSSGVSNGVLRSCEREMLLSETMRLTSGATPLSFGSANHFFTGQTAQCRPCMFERYPGRCKHGLTCDFCHLHYGYRGGSAGNTSSAKRR